MNNYIFYTDEGQTFAPNDECINNLQILGFEKGDTQEEALENLYKNNAWIEEYGFSRESIVCRAITEPQ
mgnify:FL=1